MARRNLTLTLTFTLDEDLVRDHDIPIGPDGDSNYADSINLLRTTVHHQANLILEGLDPQLDPPEVTYHGIDYNPTDTVEAFRADDIIL